MGSGALCMGCNLREENPAPQARKRVQAQPAGPARRVEPAFKRTCRIRGVRGFLWEVGTSYNERRFLWGVVHFV